MRIRPKDAGALAAIRELSELAVVRPDVAKRFREFVDVGAPIFRGKVDHDAAHLAGEFIAVFESSDDFHAFMSALRAGNR